VHRFLIRRQRRDEESRVEAAHIVRRRDPVRARQHDVGREAQLLAFEDLLEGDARRRADVPILRKRARARSSFRRTNARRAIEREQMPASSNSSRIAAALNASASSAVNPQGP
jgi:hypothetical protein